MADHIIVDDLILGGLIRGVNVTRDLVLKDGSQQHQRITGTKSFSGQLVSESFHVSDKLNNVNPREVCQTSIPPQTSKWIVYGKAIFFVINFVYVKFICFLL